MDMNDVHGRHLALPLFPLLFNLAYKAPSPGPCCMEDAERKHLAWCRVHHATTNRPMQDVYLTHVEAYLPVLRRVRWFQDVFIRVADLPGQMQGVTTRQVCDSCQRDYRIIVFSASLLAATLHLNLLPLLLVTENGNGVAVRAPTRNDMAHLHVALKSYLDGVALSDEGLNMLAELAAIPCKPGGHVNYLMSIAGLGSLFFLTHEIAHHFVGFAGARVDGWNAPGRHAIPEKRARKWTAELTADIDGARLMHEALLAARFGSAVSAIERVEAARTAFSAAMGILEALCDIEALQRRGKRVDFLHDRQWSQHPPFIYRCMALRQYAENFSRNNLDDADMFEHVRILSRLRGTLFEQYDPNDFTE